jgi:hypothetical protein
MANRLILVTGTRNELSREGKELIAHTLLRDVNAHICEEMPEVMYLHGACPTGVDKYIDDAFYPCWQFPASGKSAPVRNQVMVECARWFRQYGHSVVCYAFPHIGDEETIDCLSRAERAGIETVEIQLTLDHLSLNRGKAEVMRKWLQDVDFEDVPLILIIVLIVAYLGAVFYVYGWPWH